MWHSRSAASIEVQHMSSAPVGDQKDNWVWRGFGRWRLVIVAAVGLVAVGALLLWGPIGLGNGPLTAADGSSVSWPDSGGGPVGFVIAFRNPGDAPAVVDSVELIGGTRYAAPRLLRLEVLTAGRCGGPWPARQAGRGFTLVGCGGTAVGPLLGSAVGGHHTAFFGFPAAAEVAAPGPGTCWVMTKMVTHYHVGIRHYSASDRRVLVVCADPGQVKSAMTAAEAAG